MTRGKTPEPIPSRAQKARRDHNSRVEAIPVIWSWADFQAWYTDDTGKSRHEVGDGHFILVRPKAQAFADWQKLGEVAATVVCNNEYFWVIEYEPEMILHVGRNENAYSECCAEPQFIHPLDILPLSGLVPIPDNAAFQDMPSTANDGEQFVWTFGSGCQRLSVRLYLEAPTYLPWRVELVSNTDQTIVGTSLLTDYRPFGTSIIPHSLVLTSPKQHNAQLRIVVHEATTRPPSRKEIDPSLFDLDKAIDGAGKRCKRVVLDAECPHPALPPDH